MPIKTLTTKEILQTFEPEHLKDLAQVHKDVAEAWSGECDWPNHRPGPEVVRAREAWKASIGNEWMAIHRDVLADCAQLSTITTDEQL